MTFDYSTMIDKTTGRWYGRIWFHPNRVPLIPKAQMKLTDDDKAHGWQEMHVQETLEDVDGDSLDYVSLGVIRIEEMLRREQPVGDILNLVRDIIDVTKRFTKRPGVCRLYRVNPEFTDTRLAGCVFRIPAGGRPNGTPGMVSGFIASMPYEVPMSALLPIDGE